MSGVFRPWLRQALRRRRILTLLSFLPTAFITWYQWCALQGSDPFTESLFLAAQFLLLGFVITGFWTAIAGYWVLWSGHKDEFDPVARAVAPRPACRCGILFPVYNEDMDRVLAGLANTWRSLQQTEDADHFMFFVLSDSRDPDNWVREELMTVALAAKLGLEGRLHYRRRTVNLNMKSGNVSDWVRRWGYTCDYMVVFDADSVMSGPALSTMLRTMEGNPTCGILQTNPVAVMRETLYARMQQFAGRLYGPLFSAGLRFWQQGDGHYVGHNAIMRTEAFRESCALPTLTGKPPYGGHLLSHDFVEAALMAKAGWDVWFLPELEGSWEEIPPTVLDELKRDRRWAQGNTQHLRILFAEGIRPAHRFLFVNGIFAFVASPLWAGFLVLSLLVGLSRLSDAGANVVTSVLSASSGFPIVFAFTLIALMMPKVLSAILVMQRGEARRFGGADKLLWSVFLESLFSACVASLKMAYHSKFVFQSLMGMSVRWGSQVRDDRGLSWSHAWRFFGWTTLFGAIMLAIMAHAAFSSPLLAFIGLISPTAAAIHLGAWLLPVLLGLALSVPVAVVTSRLSVGRFFRYLGLFMIPEEVLPPVELRMQREVELGLGDDMFAAAVVDPKANAIHASLQTTRRHRLALDVLEARALAMGPKGLSPMEKTVLLRDRESMTRLHWAVWHAPDDSPWTPFLTHA